MASKTREAQTLTRVVVIRRRGPEAYKSSRAPYYTHSITRRRCTGVVYAAELVLLVKARAG
jgi:hypothetical protein